ncbi:MAG TPA: hypothetical protein VN947_07990 [Polyangia bacterium]|nr:hypothetical protein [Polyangia bacterium]
MRTSARPLVISLTIFAVAGCKSAANPSTPDLSGGDVDMAGGDADMAGGDVDLAPSTIALSGTVTYVSDGNDVTEPRDFSGDGVTAFVVAKDGSFNVHPATSASPGAVTIDDVPGGRYYLKVGSAYSLEDARALTLDRTVLGRANLATNGNAAAISSFDVDTIASWQDNDALELFSAGGGTWIGDANNNVGGPLAGTMSLPALQVTLPSLMTAADQVYLTQLVYSTLAGGTGVAAAGKSWNGTYTQAATMTTTVGVTFADVAQSQSLGLTWKRSQFRAALAAANTLGSCSDTLTVSAEPELAIHGAYSDTPDIAIITPTDGTSDVTLSNVAYGNPYPTSWGLLAVASTSCSVSVAGPGGTLPLTLHASAVAQDSLGNATANGLALKVPSIGSVTIDGKDATAYQSGVGPTPTFAWVPAAGTAPSVTIQLYGIDESSGTAVATPIATLWTGSTGATSLRVPPQLLQAGSRYAAKLTVDFDSGPNLVTDASLTRVLASFSP